MRVRTAFFALGLVAMLAVPAMAAIPVMAQPSGVNFTLLGPLHDRNVFYGGSVLDVRFQLTDSSGSFITTATATIWVDGQPGTATGQLNTENMFVVNGHTYVYKLNTKPLAAGPGSPTHTIEIMVTLLGGPTFSESFGPIALH